MSIPQLIDDLGGPEKLAAQLGANVWTVRKWRYRKRIPTDSWSQVLEAAKQLGYELDADKLLSLHRPAA